MSRKARKMMRINEDKVRRREVGGRIWRGAETTR